MSWVKIDDNMPMHPKIGALSDLAFRVWIESLCYASEYLTDGHLPSVFMRRVKPRAKQEIMDAGLWEQNGVGLVIHDYLEFQPSRLQVEEARSVNARRQELHRNGELKDVVRKRDDDHCRYCGVEVNWKARRGALAGTFDHVIPSGGNVVENLVVACRGCNTSKGKRTPSEAGMLLIPL